ncbi:DUF4386 domain-containing protein [Cellulomonas endophytica]|uniref:DUF4386 domain-containing protein n=1 Tax=Cellulomonas endophytica TaxID=2494735 RepID=UPI0013E97C77|nr:DUF4386 domain-containing protein [Cellulomonas endophytica]
MATTRRTAQVAGGLFLLTHVTSIPALALYGEVLGDPGIVLGGGDPGRILLGALLEVLLAFGIVGTGVTMFALVRHVDTAMGLGYAALRTLEAAVIVAGVVPLLALVTARAEVVASGTEDPAGLVALAGVLVSMHEWTFLIGPSLVCGANTTVLALVLHRSRLVPRFISTLGLVGGPLVLAAGTAQLFGVMEQLSTAAMVTALPVFAWEVCLAVRLLARGLDPAAPAAALDAAARRDRPAAAVAG